MLGWVCGGLGLCGWGVRGVGCGMRVHGVCTGVSVWRRRGMKSWRCGGCLAREQKGGQGTGSETNETTIQHCGECRVKLRWGQGGVRCEECGVGVHKKCCGLSRWAMDRGERWRCRRCERGGGAEGGERAGLVGNETDEEERPRRVWSPESSQEGGGSREGDRRETPALVTAPVGRDSDAPNCGICRVKLRRGQGRIVCGESVE